MKIFDVRFLNVDKLYEATRFINANRNNVKQHNYDAKNMVKYFNIAQVSMSITDISGVELYILKQISSTLVVENTGVFSSIGTGVDDEFITAAIQLSNISNNLLEAFDHVVNMNDKSEKTNKDNVKLNKLYNRAKDNFIAGLPASLSKYDVSVSFTGSELLWLMSLPAKGELFGVFTNIFNRLFPDGLKPYHASEWSEDELDKLYTNISSEIIDNLIYGLYTIMGEECKVSNDELSHALICGDCVRELPKEVPVVISYIKTEYGCIDFIEDSRDAILNSIKRISGIYNGEMYDKSMIQYTFSLKTSFFTFLALATALPKDKVVLLDKIAILNADAVQCSESLFPGFTDFSDFMDRECKVDDETDIYNIRIREAADSYKLRLYERYKNFYKTVSSVNKKQDLKDSIALHLSIPNQTAVHYIITMTQPDIRYFNNILKNDETRLVCKLIKSQIDKLC